MNTLILYSVTLLLFIVSWAINPLKTEAAFKKGAKLFLHLLPSLLSILMLVSLSLTLIGPDILHRWMGPEAGFSGFVVGAMSGAIAMIPPFVAFPMSAMLIDSGISVPVMGVFLTSLMMVGIVTLPLEAKFFGWPVTLTRNLFCFLGALIVGTGISLLWGLF
jgi:uncharacterized membrane protein YraQ (UPF0718 family)